ncbi:hypothetical protein U1Q18_034264 [Sarracenia purpurea var. burkii]
MVEQPGQKSAGRSSQVARSVTASQGRPLSADDIQKAKMRAQFMQCKYGKTGASSGDGHQVTEGPTKISFSQARTLPLASKAYVQLPQAEDHKDPVLLPSQVTIKQEYPLDNEMNLDTYEPLWKKCKRFQIVWHTPAEVRIHDAWRVGTGENSKEVEVQRNRIRREKETIYRTSQEIPSDPKEPWDREMEYDDSLTLEIPTEQLPDADGGETEAAVVSPRQEENNAVVATRPESSSQNSNGAGGVPEPDLELLAVLLKNPELVFALTAGQGGGGAAGGVGGGGLSSQETVKLLDMIKANGVASLSSLTGGLGRNAEERVQVSLPSPTPSSDPVTSGWRQEVSKNPFSRHREMVTIAVEEKRPVSEPAVSTVYLARPELPPINFMAQQLPSIASHSHHASHQFSSHRTVVVLPEQRPPPMSAPFRHSAATTSSNIPPPDAVLNIKNIPPNRSVPPNLAASTLVETSIHNKPVPTSMAVNAPPPPAVGRQSVAFSSASLMPMQPHPSFEPESLHSGHSWGANQNNYNAFVGGLVEPPVRLDPPRVRDVRETEYELWSPENSPTRSPEYAYGRNYRQPRVNLSHNYRSEPVPDRSRSRDSSGHRNYNDRHGNRRWRDWRR